MGRRGPKPPQIPPPPTPYSPPDAEMARWRNPRVLRWRRVAAFCRCLPVPSGRHVGRLMRLQPFQLAFLRDVYGTRKRRRVRQALLSMPRKNGKTGLVTALLLAHLSGPEATPQGEGYSIACDADQAAIVYRWARTVVAWTPWLAERVLVRESRLELVDEANGSTFAALSAIAETKHGRSPSFVVCDELGQARDRALYDAMATSGGARDESLMVVISTRPRSDAPKAHPMNELLRYAAGVAAGEWEDPTFAGHVHAAADDADPWDPATWSAANPGLDTIRSRSDLESLAARAQALPSFEAEFRRLYLNQHHVSAGAFRWLSRDTWGRATAAESLAGRDVHAAIDFWPTSYLALAAAARVGADLHAWTWLWMPAARVEAAAERDGMGEQYAKWSLAGHIGLTPGEVIDYARLAALVRESLDDVRVERLLVEPAKVPLVAAALPEVGIAAHGQGYSVPAKRKDRPAPPAAMPTAIDALEAACLQGRLRVRASPVLTWSIATAPLVEQPSDSTRRRFDRSGRVTAVVALAMAVGAAERGADGDERRRDSRTEDFILAELYDPE